ncbi:hypothetical protein H9P43_005651 [Blastocladiella emersonii ATCC 22665]|nr:hypothetical protein H9P43_005651 [Blastocladiella emersonii ATCC 22665]
MNNLAGRNLTGTIPKELGQLTELEVLELYDNKLSGPIPAELGELSQLQSLDLQSNKLTGLIPRELGKLRKLTSLVLDGNQLTGPIPDEFRNLTTLTNLSVDDAAQVVKVGGARQVLAWQATLALLALMIVIGSLLFKRGKHARPRAIDVEMAALLPNWRS